MLPNCNQLTGQQWLYATPKIYPNMRIYYFFGDISLEKVLDVMRKLFPFLGNIILIAFMSLSLSWKQNNLISP
jgi:hypothetical protein